MLEDWLVGVVDFNGHIGMRLGKRQLQPYIMIYSRKRGNLKMLREVWPDFSLPIYVSKNLYMSQIVSIRGMLRLLNLVLPRMHILHNVGGLTVEFCKSRLQHVNEKYTLPELQLVRRIITLTSRPASLEQRLEVLEQWL